MRTSVESARGCGYRKPGGYYLVGPELGETCPRLPFPLDRCPSCGGGIGPARGFTWITPAVILPAQLHSSIAHNARCPLGAEQALPGDMKPGHEHQPILHRMGDRAGLIWVGEQFYPTPESFLEEASRMGVSRRVQRPPRGFKVGEQWIALGHPKAIPIATSEIDEVTGEEGNTTTGFAPGVITLFKPTALEYIVRDDDTPEFLDSLEQRGITPVKVIRDIDQ